MHASKLIEATVQRHLKDMVSETKKMFDTLSPHVDSTESKRMKDAVAYLETEQQTMLDGFASVLEGGHMPGTSQRTNKESASKENDTTDSGKRFNPMDLLERLDAETVGKGLDVVQSMVKVFDDLKKRKRV